MTAGVVGSRWNLPEAYATSGVAIALRVCERFGRDPFGGWWEGLGPGQQAVLLANERIRMAEEDRASMMMAMGSARAAV